ncbi:MAG: hypothetical protein GX334_06470 [Firmicutes bacterium]|nr:hypothetical protein [Bacillota bacterium]
MKKETFIMTQREITRLRVINQTIDAGECNGDGSCCIQWFVSITAN